MHTARTCWSTCDGARLRRHLGHGVLPDAGVADVGEGAHVLHAVLRQRAALRLVRAHHGLEAVPVVGQRLPRRPDGAEHPGAFVGAEQEGADELHAAVHAGPAGHHLQQPLPGLRLLRRPLRRFLVLASSENHSVSSVRSLIYEELDASMQKERSNRSRPTFCQK
jgi:hypothetical protein